MSQKAVDLKSMALWFPPLGERDWDDAIRKAGGVEKNLLRIQARAANLLLEISDQRVTFARLAWLNLWTKAFAALDGAVCALPMNSLYVLRMVARASFEQMLHAQSIMEPVRKIYSGPEASKEKVIPPGLIKDREEESVKRLEAYAAWCIWNDHIFYEQLVRSETLDSVWDGDPSRQIAWDLESLRAYESIYGQLKIELDERELKKGRLRQQDEGLRKLHRIRTWLDYPDLKSWHEKLKKDKFMTFFTLVGEAKTGVKKSLEYLDLSFGYPVYSVGSMAIHGSSLDQFLYFGNERVMPLFIGADDEVSEKAEEVGYNCNQVIIALYMLIKLIWPKQLQSDISIGSDAGQKK